MAMKGLLLQLDTSFDIQTIRNWKKSADDGKCEERRHLTVSIAEKLGVCG